jgi:hypothetical protein
MMGRRVLCRGCSARCAAVVVGIALLPALSVSIAIVMIGRVLDFPDLTVNRVSGLVFFALFLGGYHYASPCRGSTSSTMR